MAKTLTRLLRDWRSGDSTALDALMPLIYDELRQLARAQLAHERADHTLGPTAVVHEAYLRMLGCQRVDWQSRAHFLALAAITIRRLLVSHARKRRAAKRGPENVTVCLHEEQVATPEFSVDMLALDGALAGLADFDPRQSRVVELRFFGGLTVEETATVLGVSPATVKNDWKMARSWLFNHLEGG
jgi:RNA polymerase sigma factor (TIGR02999 family)